MCRRYINARYDTDIDAKVRKLPTCLTTDNTLKLYGNLETPPYCLSSDMRIITAMINYLTEINCSLTSCGAVGGEVVSGSLSG